VTKSEEFESAFALTAGYKGMDYGKRSDNQGDFTFIPHESSDRGKRL